MESARHWIAGWSPWGTNGDASVARWAGGGEVREAELVPQRRSPECRGSVVTGQPGWSPVHRNPGTWGKAVLGQQSSFSRGPWQIVTLLCCDMETPG